ncbi:MAG: hypothetical protein K9G58_10635 [Bacteroidales bacterium]|nr:hypothetical protein [Melioribacteraceae bacterium]MCF8398618.1 hypothetical protein [Bacteroidales bacterium]
MIDFTFKKYTNLINAIKENNIKVYKVKDWINESPRSGIVIRHDVDRLPGNALQMAMLENEHGIHTTYYFRIMKHVFKPYIIKQIEDLGHEIGYHYEDLSLAKGDISKSKSLFQQHLNWFNEIEIDVSTVAMHGRPISRFDNRDIWENFNLSDFDLNGEAFISIDYRDIIYFTDTGRSWADKSINLRDKVKSEKSSSVVNTLQLIKYLNKNSQNKYFLVVHPERWNDNLFKWISYYVWDLMANFVKHIVKKIRG